jgi:hypothetical protein
MKEEKIHLGPTYIFFDRGRRMVEISVVAIGLVRVGSLLESGSLKSPYYLEPSFYTYNTYDEELQTTYSEFVSNTVNHRTGRHK